MDEKKMTVAYMLHPDEEVELEIAFHMEEDGSPYPCSFRIGEFRVISSDRKQLRRFLNRLHDELHAELRLVKTPVRRVS